MKIRRAKVALVACVILLLSLTLLADSGSSCQWLFRFVGSVPAGDKVGHVVLFGVLSFLANLLSRGRTIKWLDFKVLKWSAVLMFVVTLEEFSQLFFRSRNFDLLDLASDAVGIWLFGRLALGYLNRKRRILPSTAHIPPSA